MTPDTVPAREADLMDPLANQVADPPAATVITLSLAAAVAVTTFTPW